MWADTPGMLPCWRSIVTLMKGLQCWPRYDDRGISDGFALFRSIKRSVRLAVAMNRTKSHMGYAKSET